MTDGGLASLTKLGEEVRNAAYLALSQWRYPQPQDLTTLETTLQAAWEKLSVAEASKRAVLDDEVARLLYAEQTRLLASQHEDKHKLCASLAEAKDQQLSEEYTIASIADAQVLLGQLDSNDQEREAQVSSAVASLKALGKSICDRKYSSALSSYTYEKPEEIKVMHDVLVFVSVCLVSVFCFPSFFY